jgi:hypothetical protein
MQVQSSALIEMSVEKEKWVAERCRMQQREREATARLQLLAEEKGQVREMRDRQT